MSMSKPQKWFPVTRYNRHRWMFWRRWEAYRTYLDTVQGWTWSETKSADEVMFPGGKG